MPHTVIFSLTLLFLAHVTFLGPHDPFLAHVTLSIVKPGYSEEICQISILHYSQVQLYMILDRFGLIYAVPYSKM